MGTVASDESAPFSTHWITMFMSAQSFNIHLALSNVFTMANLVQSDSGCTQTLANRTRIWKTTFMFKRINPTLTHLY
jgi:hypothetical protein